MNSLAEKLHPDNFTAMSGKMAAILGYVLDEEWSKPRIAELHVTSDGFMLAREQGDIGCNSFIDSVADWHANLARLFNVAELTPEEQQAFGYAWCLKVKDWRL